MVREAKLDGRQVNLVTASGREGPGSGELLLSKTGRAILSLQIVGPGGHRGRH